MPEPRRRAPWMMRPRQPAMQTGGLGRRAAMPVQGRPAGRGAFAQQRTRRGAMPAAFARGRRGAAAIPPEFGARSFTRDRTDTGGMRMKPGWARSGWSGVPVIGPVLGLFDWLRNLIFRGEEARLAKRQIIGPFGRKGMPVPAEGPEITPQDMEALTLGTGRFAQRGARQGAAQRGARQRAITQGVVRKGAMQ